MPLSKSTITHGCTQRGHRVEFAVKAAMSDAPAPEIKITEGAKAVMNDPGVVATAEKVLKAAFGDKRPSPPGTPSEDFSEFINAGVPSMFFNIGVYEPERVAARHATDPGRNCRPIIRRCSLRCRNRPSKLALRP
jgi:metal-dependent amidase/aminoacylase/carboxypeptidase family protein